MRACRTFLPIALVAVAFLNVRAGSGYADADKFQRNRLSHIRGSSIENYDGEKLGQLSDFIVALPAGKVEYVVIKSHGLAGLGSTSKIVPAHLLSGATIKKNVLELDVSLQKLKNAPRFRKSDLAALGNPRRSAEISRYYRSPAQPGPTPTGSPTSAEMAQARSIHDSARQPDTLEYQLASDMIGAKVYDRQNEPLAQISDLLIDLSWQKPPIAIISTKGIFQRRTTLAVPLYALSGKRNMKLEVDHVAVKKAPLFTSKAWQSSRLDMTPIYLFSE